MKLTFNVPISGNETVKYIFTLQAQNVVLMKPSLYSYQTSKQPLTAFLENRCSQNVVTLKAE